MPLWLNLFLVFLAFCAVMSGVMALCFRERRHVIDNTLNTHLSLSEKTAPRPDNRLALILFGCIIVGALLALLTAYLVFFRTQI